MAVYPFRSALVTGASAGIGAEMARQLGDAGVPTVVVARREDRLVELAAEYDGFEILAADLLSDEGQQAVMDRVASVDDPIDLVVNNAGFGTGGTFWELDAERLGDEVELNVKALTKISNVALGTMAARQGGYLLNVSSIASFQAAPGLAVYAATKAYVTSLSEALHEEMRGTGVHVTALCPGLTKTEFQEKSNTSNLEGAFPDAMWTSAESVARAGLDGVAKNRAIVVPGLVNKGITTASDLIPRSITRRLSGLSALRN
ncbi:MAG: SDR family NAD(P)-dependent oxidoreductase [Ilumatobacter sp.]